MLRKLQHHPHASHGRGLFGNLVTTAEYVGASYLFGWAWFKKPKLFGADSDLAVGVGLKGLSLLATLTGKATFLCPHLDVVGNAGIGAWAHGKGAGHGARSAGVTRMLLPKGADLNKVKSLVPGSEVLGAIEPAPPGQLLSIDALERISRR